MPTEFFLDQIEDEKEAWQEDHAQAMKCRDLEDLVKLGIGLYHLIRLGDRGWSKKVQAGTAKFDPEKVRIIQANYRWWLAPCATVARAVQAMETYYKVEGAEEFRACWREARNYASIDVESLIESAAQTRSASTSTERSPSGSMTYRPTATASSST